MNQNLLNILSGFTASMKKTKGVLGAWNFGSALHGTSDEYSDVDIVFLIEENAFQDMESKVSAILTEKSDGIALCWGEGFNGRAIISNSYLLKKEGQVLQFDVVLLNRDCISDSICRIHYMDLSEKDIFFDNEGAVRKLCADCPHGSPWKSDTERMALTYYLFFHMTAKYLNRQDYFKLNMTMRTLYDTHVSLLLTEYDSLNWGGAESKLHFLPAGKQAHLKKYYCTDDFALNRTNLAQSLEWFEEDLADIPVKNMCECDKENFIAVKEYWNHCTADILQEKG